MTEQEYFDAPGLNASTLKQLHNPKWIKWRKQNPETEDDDKTHFRIGSAIDCLLTRPEDYKAEFSVTYKERPGGLMGVFIDYLPLDLTEESHGDEYMVAYEKAGYKMALPTVIASLWKEPKYRDYYMSRKQAQGKTIISLEEHEQIMNCYEALINNPYTRAWFMETSPDVKLVMQVKLFFTFMDIPCKSMVDVIRINHKEKTIELGDLKTTIRSVLAFRNAYKGYKYYLQAAFYYIGLELCLKDDMFKLANPWAEKCKDYRIVPMQFIVAEKKGSNPARIFATTEEELGLSISGRWKDGEYIPGVKELVNSYKWHVENDSWQWPKDLIENKGVYKLEL